MDGPTTPDAEEAATRRTSFHVRALGACTTGGLGAAGGREGELSARQSSTFKNLRSRSQQTDTGEV